MPALLFSPPTWQPLTGSAVTLPGAKLFFYKTGTTTDQTVYSESTLTTAHAQPVVADSDGIFAPIYLDTGNTDDYKAVLKDSADVTLDTIDPLSNAASATSITPTIFQNHITGLVPSLDADTAHDINFTAGVATDSTNAVFMSLDTEITKQIDAAWSVGDDAGGLFTGTVANATWYHLFIIRNPTTGVVDAGFDTSLTAANAPSGYTQFRRRGSVLTDGSANITAFTASEVSGGGLWFRWDIGVSDTDTTNPGTARVTEALTVPTGVQVEAEFSIKVTDSTPGVSTSILVTELSQTDTSPGSVFMGRVPGSGASVPAACSLHLRIITDTSAQIGYRLSNSNADIGVFIDTHGWLDSCI